MDIRVCIFEDNKLVRDALCTIMSGTQGFLCCGSFPDAVDVESRIRHCRPDVVLMDIEMPKINGIEATKIIRQQFPAVHVLIQTVFNDNEKIFKALCAGASGYLIKSDPLAKQLEAIQNVYNGEAFISPSIARNILSFFSNKNVILVEPQQVDYEISRREKEILQMMVEGFHLKEIGARFSISYETVRTHVKNIYRKLHVANRTEAVLKVKQQHIL